MTGIVKGYEIKKNRDGKNNVVMLQCEINGSSDTQSVELFNPVGDNSIPVMNSVVMILEAGGSWKIAVAQNDQKDFKSGLNEGEKYLYSKDENSFIKIKNDGTIEINGDADYAVRFNELKTGFDQLKSDFNNFLIHVHGSSGTPPVPPAVPSSASIDNSKVDEVTLPW